MYIMIDSAKSIFIDWNIYRERDWETERNQSKGKYILELMKGRQSKKLENENS